MAMIVFEVLSAPAAKSLKKVIVSASIPVESVMTCFAESCERSNAFCCDSSKFGMSSPTPRVDADCRPYLLERFLVDFTDIVQVHVRHKPCDHFIKRRLEIPGRQGVALRG